MTALALRRPAWLLVLSPLPFAAWLAALVPAMSRTGVANAADLSPDQMASVRGGWAVAWIIYRHRDPWRRRASWRRTWC
jgi:hypothetical protein